MCSTPDVQLQVKHAGTFSHYLQPCAYVSRLSSYHLALSPDMTAACSCDSNPANLLLARSSALCLQAQVTSVIALVVVRCPSLRISTIPALTLTSPQGLGIQAICLKPPQPVESAHSCGVISSYWQTRKMHQHHGHVREMIVRIPSPSGTS